MIESHAESGIRQVYSETRAFYEKRKGTQDWPGLGFRVLYGPPIVDAPYLFLGYQPGGRQKAADVGLAEGQHESWPDQSWYLHAEPHESPLATKLQKLLGREVVAQCTGLNAIFFRAPTISAWKGIRNSLRSELEAFSLERAERIVRALRPREILVIGLGTFGRLTHGESVLKGSRGNVLARHGTLWGCPATGIVHLSGALIPREDCDALAHFFQGRPA